MEEQLATKAEEQTAGAKQPTAEKPIEAPRVAATVSDVVMWILLMLLLSVAFWRVGTAAMQHQGAGSRGDSSNSQHQGAGIK